MSGSLAGRGIVITRPQGESQRLAALIREAGGVPLVFPSIEILEAPDPAAVDTVISRLDEFDFAIFISPSAVDQAMTRIRARRAWPPRLRCAAIGPGGARALQAWGVTDVIAAPLDAKRVDSEALLAMPLLQDVRGKRVVIFRGDGGRELLRDTLRMRGASVEAVTCYRRGKPSFDPAPLNAALARGEVAAVLITSSEGLHNFCERLGTVGVTYLKQTLIVVPHPRIAAVACELGLTHVIESPTGDQAMLATLIRTLTP